MPRGVAPHNEGCSYRARHFNQCITLPQGVALGYGQQLGVQPAPFFSARHIFFSPPHFFQPATKYLSDRPNCSFETSIAPLSPVTANAITGEFFPFPLKFFPVCFDNFHFLGDIFCYKLANMCYKLCNTYSKLWNIYSKLWNKKIS